jgi:mRNA-degrading endonuclease RelE of RelBE toxin-antitoxin system
MKSRVVWTEQVQHYVNSKAPEPRRELWQEIKRLADWNGRENPPRIRRLEDDLTGYLRLRVGRLRVLFFENFDSGQRTIECIMAGPRNTIYETFAELLLDELSQSGGAN